jgi:hypothetical protein
MWKIIFVFIEHSVLPAAVGAGPAVAVGAGALTGTLFQQTPERC